MPRSDIRVMESLVWHGTRKDIDKDTSATPWVKQEASSRHQPQSRNTILLRLILRQRPGENEQWRRILPDDVLVDGSTPDMLKSLKKQASCWSAAIMYAVSVGTSPGKNMKSMSLVEMFIRRLVLPGGIPRYDHDSFGFSMHATIHS
ncbi:hypothetical protein CFRS1_v015159 [Colletotrichum fructicola]|nr:hypothetical protein CFRS1_v015159 [Colletotrichum fructicola]